MKGFLVFKVFKKEFIIITLLFIILNCFGNDDNRYKDRVDLNNENEIFSSFIKNEFKIIKDEKGNLIEWQPNVEQLKILKQDENYIPNIFQTKIIKKYLTKENELYFIFETKCKGESNPLASLALGLMIINNKDGHIIFSNLNFANVGSFGFFNKENINIEQIGEKNTGIIIKNGFIGQGILSIFLEIFYFDGYEVKEIFKIEIAGDNSGIIPKGDIGFWEYYGEYYFIKSGKNIYDFEIKFSGSKYDQKNNNINKMDKIIHYEFKNDKYIFVSEKYY